MENIKVLTDRKNVLAAMQVVDHVFTLEKHDRMKDLIAKEYIDLKKEEPDNTFFYAKADIPAGKVLISASPLSTCEGTFDSSLHMFHWSTFINSIDPDLLKISIYPLTPNESFRKLKREFLENDVTLDVTDAQLLFVIKLRSNVFISNIKNKKLLYWLPSFVNHSCLPNCGVVFDEDDRINIYSTMDIKRGQAITHSYSASHYDDTQTRKENIMEIFDFDCKCECCDEKNVVKRYPTEWFTMKRITGTDLFEKNCWYCGKMGIKMSTCSKCKLASYCGKDCQTKHWKQNHKFSCGKSY